MTLVYEVNFHTSMWALPLERRVTFGSVVVMLESSMDSFMIVDVVVIVIVWVVVEVIVIVVVLVIVDVEVLVVVLSAAAS